MEYIMMTLTVVCIALLYPVLRMSEHKASKGSKTEAMFLTVDNSRMLKRTRR